MSAEDLHILKLEGHAPVLPFAQKITGFVETDLGLGLVMETALDSEGNLAPTLASIAFGKRLERYQNSPAARSKIKEFQPRARSHSSSKPVIPDAA